MLKGHALINEGVGYSPDHDPKTVVARYWWLPHDPAGVAVCRCGATSEPLPSTAARKRWHREHKQAVLDAEDGA